MNDLLTACAETTIVDGSRGALGPAKKSAFTSSWKTNVLPEDCVSTAGFNVFAQGAIHTTEWPDCVACRSLGKRPESHRCRREFLITRTPSMAPVPPGEAERDRVGGCLAVCVCVCGFCEVRVVMCAVNVMPRVCMNVCSFDAETTRALYALTGLLHSKK